ncbi:MAG: hypothetical protein KAT70_08115 [Thermoplasmata archaeon]|nr:hypothetical protein [Thermoplasmata archaeon]
MRDNKDRSVFWAGFFFLVGLWLLALSVQGCAMRHELTEEGHPDYHGCPPVDRAYLEGCPELDSLRGCPYMDRPCEYFHASSFIREFPLFTCAERLEVRVDFCPELATDLWPPTPGLVPCCTLEENL